jgi:exodeoxyribonuclease VII small subunit
MATDKTDAKLSYEAARDELAQVVSSLEGGQSTLEESLALWERGEVLAKICQEWLDGAKAKLAAARPDDSSEKK